MLTIFPNVRAVEASCFDTTFDPLFFSPSIKDLRLSLNVGPTVELNKEDMAWKLGEIPGRMPHLTGLIIFSNIKAHIIIPPICRVLEGLQDLVNVTLPSRIVVSSTLEVLSRINRLRIIRVVNPPGSFYEPPSSLSPELASGCFPSLKCLCFLATLPDVTRLLQNPNFPSHNLIALTLQAAISPDHHLPQDHLSRFISTVAKNCAIVQDLRVILDVNDRIASEALTRSPVVRFTDIAQILELQCLTTVVIKNATAIIMTDDDAKAFARALPQLRILNITGRALIAHPSEPCLTLRSVIHFGEECPNLRFLGLHLDASNNIPSPSEVVILHHLRTLYLGYSTIASVKPVVWFLARALPFQCLLGVLSDSIEDSTLSMSPVESTTEQHRKWREAQTALLWIQESKEMWRGKETSLKSKVRMLEKEVAVLRTQLDDVIERSQM